MTARDQNDKSRKGQRTRTQASGNSRGVRVTPEETEYQREARDAGIGSPQMGGSRAESKLAGRSPDHPHSRQNMLNDVVNIEGEEPEFQNAGVELPRQRANQQSVGQKKATPDRDESRRARSQEKRRAS